MPTTGGSGDQPNFASVYGDDDILTPRLAAHLWGGERLPFRYLP